MLAIRQHTFMQIAHTHAQTYRHTQTAVETWAMAKDEIGDELAYQRDKYTYLKEENSSVCAKMN